MRDYLLNYARSLIYTTSLSYANIVAAECSFDMLEDGTAQQVRITPPPTRPFAMHRPAASLITRLAAAVSFAEPVLLTGETGTGKTSVVTHLASLLRRPLCVCSQGSSS